MESFFTFLNKLLSNCQPSVNSYLQRSVYDVVIPNSDGTKFYPVLSTKLIVLSILRPETPKLFRNSRGMYYQKIEEVNSKSIFINMSMIIFNSIN